MIFDKVIFAKEIEHHNAVWEKADGIARTYLTSPAAFLEIQLEQAYNIGWNDGNRASLAMAKALIAEPQGESKP